MSDPQPGILLPVPPLARYMAFSLTPGVEARASLRALREMVDGERLVIGVGASLVRALKRNVDGLRAFPAVTGAGIDVPSTPCAVWVWARGTDRGDLFHQSRLVERALAGAFQLEDTVDAFQYLDGRDLTGYEDGTENPRGEQAREVAIVRGRAAGLDGSSFVAVQQWVHRFDRFEAMAPAEQDETIGRRRVTNDEIEDAPPSAHVKRAAQESFQPAAFLLRRSMPWADAGRGGLMFVAFGASLDAFEAVLRRMVGLEDGVADALFRFTRPVSGAYYWCPGMRDGRIDLSVLGV